MMNQYWTLILVAILALLQSAAQLRLVEADRLTGESVGPNRASSKQQVRQVAGPFDASQFLLHREQRSSRLQPQGTFEQVDNINQLTELIAQAHNDKPLEARLLLKKLIQAHLRPEVASYYANNNYLDSQTSQLEPAQENWQDSAGDNTDQLVASQLDFGQTPSRSAAAAALLDGATETLAPPDLKLLDQIRYQASLAKREYIKPCSFNAVSCAKNPFRRL